MAFKKGQGGRPPGVPNRASREIKAAARLMVEDEGYQASLKERLTKGTAPHMETLLFQYAYGKPKDTTAHEGTIRLHVQWLP